MDRLETMTQDQERMLLDFREECLQIGLFTGAADIESARPAINALYGETRTRAV